MSLQVIVRALLASSPPPHHRACCSTRIVGFLGQDDARCDILNRIVSSDRDEFAPQTKRVIAERACYVCSNPSHRTFTIQAHSDPEKSLSSGVAAHIRGAAQNGPRYDPGQSRAERRHPQNGIWLCHSCSDLVDKDETKFTVAVLEGWRSEHERWVANQGMVARLPEISISTLNGLSLPPTGGKITAAEIAFYRQHTMIVRNPGPHRIDGLSARLQLPERAIVGRVEKPPGVSAELKPQRMLLLFEHSFRL